MSPDIKALCMNFESQGDYKMWGLHMYFLNGILFLSDMYRKEQSPFHLLHLLYTLISHSYMYFNK